MKKIAIYTFFNDKFFEYGFTMIHSFLATNKWFEGDIYILSDNGENCSLSEENFAILRKLYNGIFLYKIDIEQYRGIFNNFPSMHRKEFKASFYKLEMFKKDDYDFKFYIDADVCFNASIEELFSQEYDNIFALMCRDSVSDNFFTKEITLKTNDDYANMGFLIVNGKLIKENDYQTLISGCENIKEENYINKHTFRGKYGEQDCLNEFVKSVALLPAMVYDAAVSYINIDNINDVKIFHFYGLEKPWGGNFEHIGFYVWYKHYFFAMKELKKLLNNR